MKTSKSFDEQSRWSWYTVAPKITIGAQSKEPPHPSDTQLILGCLQRIAASLEKIDTNVRYNQTQYLKEQIKNKKLRTQIKNLKAGNK